MHDSKEAPVLITNLPSSKVLGLIMVITLTLFAAVQCTKDASADAAQAQLDLFNSSILTFSTSSDVHSA